MATTIMTHHVSAPTSAPTPEQQVELAELAQLESQGCQTPARAEAKQARNPPPAPRKRPREEDSQDTQSLSCARQLDFSDQPLTKQARHSTTQSSKSPLFERVCTVSSFVSPADPEVSPLLPESRRAVSEAKHETKKAQPVAVYEAKHETKKAQAVFYPDLAFLQVLAQEVVIVIKSGGDEYRYLKIPVNEFLFQAINKIALGNTTQRYLADLRHRIEYKILEDGFKVKTKRELPTPYVEFKEKEN